MNTGRRIIKNFFSLFIGDIVIKIFGTILNAFIFRIFGPTNFGQLTFATAFVSYFNLFSDFGLSSLGIREIARSKDKTNLYATNILAIQLIISFLLLGIILVSLIFLPVDLKTKVMIIVLGLAIIPGALNLAYIMHAHEKMEYIALSKFLAQLGSVIASFLLIYIFRDILVLAIISLVSAVINSYIVLIILRKKFSFRWGKVDKQLMKTLFITSIPFVISSLALQIYYNADTILLQFMKGTEQVGFYGAAYKVPLLLIGIVFNGIGALYPMFSSLFANQEEKATHKHEGLIAAIIAIGSVCTTLFFIFFAPEIIRILAGRKFQDSVIPMSILMLQFLFACFNGLNSTILVAANYQKHNTIGVSIAAVLNIILNLFLIPRFGILGAATTTVLAEATATIYFVAILKNTEHNEYLSRYFLSILITLPSAIYLIFSHYTHHLNYVYMSLSSILSLSGLIIIHLKFFSRETINLLLAIVRNKKIVNNTR